MIWSVCLCQIFVPSSCCDLTDSLLGRKMKKGEKTEEFINKMNKPPNES